MKKWYKKYALLIKYGIFIVVIMLAAIGIRYWQAGGDLQCMADQNPATCVAVKQLAG